MDVSLSAPATRLPAAVPRERGGGDARLHLLDATMFWSATSGGVRRYLRAKRDWLASRDGWRHTIIAPVVTEPGMVGVPGVPLPGAPDYRVPLRRAAGARLMQDLRPDLIEAGDPWRLAWSARDAAARLGVPAVAFCHSNLAALAERLCAPLLGARGARLAAGAARRYMRHVYRGFDLVLAPSEAMRLQLLELGLERVERQPLGVDVNTFCPARRDPRWREALGLPRDARVLVYVGRFAAEKNLPLLARAVSCLGPRYWLVAIGDGPLPPSGERVLVRPFEARPEGVARALASADAAVHAGDQETFGLGVLEALACGTPVVASAAQGLAELVDVRVGMPVARQRPEAFAEAVDALFARERAALSLAARERAEAHAWDRVLPQLQARYHRLLGREEDRAPRPAPLLAEMPR
ncbi:glycosyltransferase [Caldimonas tepidiphila]|uniref:glycosyltransferase n=1 Tax=Caldimonas tepidiphila TaxID=2315841 RepID=UPI000E5C4440|nr:glycosyltransferase [Caldimonas tepidiphila]